MDVKICGLDGCDKPVASRHRLCPMHRERVNRHGDPNYVTPRRAKPSCSTPGCDRPNHSRGLCNACYQRWRRNSTPMAYNGLPRGTEPRLEARPILEMIEARGGIAECMDTAGIHNGRGGRPREALSKLYHRAKARGTLPISSADRLAIDLFSMHPAEIFGEAWWSEETNDDGVLVPAEDRAVAA